MLAGGTQGVERNTAAVRRMLGSAPGEMSTRLTARRTQPLDRTYSGNDTKSRTRLLVVDMTSMSVGANLASSRRCFARITLPTSRMLPDAGSTTSRERPSAPPPSRIRPSGRAAEVGPRVPPAESRTTAAVMGSRSTATAPAELARVVAGSSAGGTITAAGMGAVPAVIASASTRRRTMPVRLTAIPRRSTTCADALFLAAGGPTTSHRPQLPHQPRPRGLQEQAGDDVEEPT